MSRPRRKAAIECGEKLHKALNLHRKVKNNTKNQSSANEINTKACSVKISKVDWIPQSMLDKHFIKRCSIKFSKSDVLPFNTISKDSRNCVYIPLTTNSKITSKPRRQPTTAVKTTIARDNIESVYDFIPCSQNSESSGDESMKNVLKNLQSKRNVRVVKARQKGRPPKKDLHKSWTEKNIRKAKRLIKPKMNKLDKIHIINVLKDDIVIPIQKTTAVPTIKANESILPLIQDIIDDDDHFQNDDDHFQNDENDYINDRDENNASGLFNSNIENINPNSPPSKQNTLYVKPIIHRSPLKPLNTQIIIRSRPSPKKDTPTLRNKLLKRLSLYNTSIISTPVKEKPRRLQITKEPQSEIEDGNATNYFGFTSDLASDNSIKNPNENTSTPVRPTTKEEFLAKLKTLKTSVLKIPTKKCAPRTSARPQRKALKPSTQMKCQDDNTTINFSEALSSTLLQPGLSTNKNVRQTYSRHENKDLAKNQNRTMFNLFENLQEPTNVNSIPIDDDTVKKRSPIKKLPEKVYGKNKIPTTKQKPVEVCDQKLLSFYQSFNLECEEISKFNLITE